MKVPKTAVNFGVKPLALPPTIVPAPVPAKRSVAQQVHAPKPPPKVFYQNKPIPQPKYTVTRYPYATPHTVAPLLFPTTKR